MTMITLLTNSLYLQDHVSMFVFILCLYGSSSMCKICVLCFFSFECSIGINCGTNLKGAAFRSDGKTIFLVDVNSF